MTDCIFCQIVAGESPAETVATWTDAIAIVPIDPVVDGHLLVIPRHHVRDFAEDPMVTAVTMARAAEYVRDTSQHGTTRPANLITSARREATQSVFHLHVHIIPRAENDGLALPWYSGRSKKPSAVQP